MGSEIISGGNEEPASAPSKRRHSGPSSHGTLAEVRARCQKDSATERFILTLLVLRRVSIYFTYLFVRLGVRADSVTFLSFGVALSSAVALASDLPLLGGVGVVLFQILDCCDGELARWHGGSVYGEVLDSLGADVFYATVPFSVGFLLWSREVQAVGILPHLWMVIGGGVSLTYLLYRLVRTRVSARCARVARLGGSPRGPVRGGRTRGLAIIARAYRHEVVRQNLFAQPAVVLFVSVLAPTGLFGPLAVYLIVLLVYNLGYLLLEYARGYRALTAL